MQRRVSKRAGSRNQRNINAFSDHIHRAINCQQLHLRQGPTGDKLTDKLTKPCFSHKHRRADAQHSLWAFLGGHHHRSGPFLLRHQRPTFDSKLFACRRQGQTPRSSLNKPYAKALLQCSHSSA
ncbi:TPA: hypothetical protein GFX94_10360 [Escherichia coli]|nr:hypothetical protein [Escherichia coli]